MNSNSNSCDLILPARAKINLALDVLGKRADGYHEVRMIMQGLDLADIIRFRSIPEGIRITSDLAGLECDESNLAYRAAQKMLLEAPDAGGIAIHLEKHIPMGAGLAGGSTDAACVLTGLNRIWNLNLPNRRLAEIGASIGSDVPFCLYGGTMLAEGRGEILSPLPPLPPVSFVLAKPDQGISTAWVYQHFRPGFDVVHPNISGMISALMHKDSQGVARLAGNALESVTIPVCPEIADIKQRMLYHGALTSLMSGSGTTVFGIWLDRKTATDAAAAIAWEFDCWTCTAQTAVIGEENDGSQITADKTGQL